MTDAIIPKTAPGNIGCHCGAVTMGRVEYDQASPTEKAAFAALAAACAVCGAIAPKTPAGPTE
ncbi:MAG: hypothetical protein ABIV36_02060 [Sphingobium limneticum]